MKEIRAHHTDKKSQVTMIKMGDAEFVNPIEKTMNDIIDGMKSMHLSSFQFAHQHGKPSPFDKFSIDTILTTLERDGLKIWKEQYEAIMKTDLPDGIFQILNCPDKEAQIKALKPPLQLSTRSLQKFIFKAWQLYGFKFSDYRFEHQPEWVKPKEMPSIAILSEDNGVEVFGETSMKKGELKNAILHQKVTIAKFLDKDSEWHCFYYNNNSINGKEAGQEPHIHYISNNWTIDRQTIMNELRKKHHGFNSKVHIPYQRYG